MYSNPFCMYAALPYLVPPPEEDALEEGRESVADGDGDGDGDEGDVGGSAGM